MLLNSREETSFSSISGTSLKRVSYTRSKSISNYYECGLFRVGGVPVTILRAFFNQIQSLLHLVQSLDMVLVVSLQLIPVVLRINIVRLLNYSILILYEFR